MAGDKSFHSFDELVQLLESRGVFIDDSTKTVLKRESYYAVVNGYKDPFLDSTATTAAGEDRYLNGTHFSEIHLLFLLDRQIRMALLPALLIAETTLKTLTVHPSAPGTRSAARTLIQRTTERIPPQRVRWDG